jgi:uncharacterized protein
MQSIDGRLVLSASDLTGYLACEHLTQQELAVTRGELERPTRDDPELDILTQHGEKHELEHLARLRSDGGVIRNLARESYRTIADSAMVR